VTQVGEGRDAGEVPHLMTFGAPVPGDLLAERYRLEQHISDDSLGRQVWRGVDVILRRQVAVVMRYPGGDSAIEMLSAAVATSRINHSHLAGVYDVIDEGLRAYVVREWVPGHALREVVADRPLEAGHAAAVAYATACAVSAVHATGAPHGNVTPGTVMLADDGRVVLTDANASYGASMDADMRAVGGVLYSALTGHWPYAEAGPARLADAPRDQTGRLASPRQVRAGVPAYLSELTTELLDHRIAPPTAEVLAAELLRFAGPAEATYDTPGGIGFAHDPGGDLDPPRANRRKLLVGLATLILIALTIPLVAAKFWPSGNGNGPGPSPTASGPDTSTSSAATVVAIPLSEITIRGVDGKGGDRTELTGVDKALDGKTSTAWSTQHYTKAAFGGLKPGIGVLLDLRTARQVDTVTVTMTVPGATVDIRTGDEDPGSSAEGDAAILDSFVIAAQPQSGDATELTFSVHAQTRYLLVWISKLPVDPAAKNGPQYGTGIAEVVVNTAG
jgi:hypothetical protein